MAHATGCGLVDQIGNGRDAATDRASRRIDWSNPTDTLRHHSQLDGDDRTRGDTERCGATALVGGLVMSGPDAPRRLADARTRLTEHLGEVDRDLTGRGSREWSRLDSPAFRGMAESSEAHRMLDGLPADTATWTNADLSRFEEATYRAGRAEMALHDGASAPGLSGSEMRTLRDTMWGDYRPRTSDGRECDLVFAGTRDTGGAAALNHFVIGTNEAAVGTDRATVYDPWPDDNGTNYLRGAPGVGERPIGGSLATDRSDPFADHSRDPRPGVDLDFFSRID